MVDILLLRKGKSTRLVITIAEFIIWESSAMELEDCQKGQQKISFEISFWFGFAFYLKIQNEIDFKVFKIFEH